MKMPVWLRHGTTNILENVGDIPDHHVDAGKFSTFVGGDLNVS